jgi:hypothetical protein
MNKLLQEEIDWIAEREIKFKGNIRFTREEVEWTFGVWSRRQGRKVKPSGCGRCAMNVRQNLWRLYLLERDNPDIISEQNS